jgi:hypothetical protein
VPFFLLTILLIGCGGEKFYPVEGTITLNGDPVESANISLVSEDGKKTFSGFSDSTGKFVIGTPEQPGAPAGNYKVTVVKTKMIEGSESMQPGSDEYLKMMEKQRKETAKASSGSTTTGPGMMKGMPPGGMKGMPPGVGPPGKGPGMKSDLPLIYASLNSTTLSLKVPVENQPAKIELTGKK